MRSFAAPRYTSLLVVAAVITASACTGASSDSSDPCFPIVAGLVVYMPAVDLLVRDARGNGLAFGDTAIAYSGGDSVITRGYDTLHLAAGPAAPGTYTVRVKRHFYQDGVVRDVVVLPGRCGGPTSTKVPLTLQLAPGAPPLRSVAVLGADVLYAPGVQRQLVARVDADAGVPTTVSWRLSDTTIARIDASGLVTAKCTLRDGATDTVTAMSTADTSVQGRAVFGVARQLSCP